MCNAPFTRIVTARSPRRVAAGAQVIHRLPMPYKGDELHHSGRPPGAVRQQPLALASVANCPLQLTHELQSARGSWPMLVTRRRPSALTCHSYACPQAGTPAPAALVTPARGAATWCCPRWALGACTVR